MSQLFCFLKSFLFHLSFSYLYLDPRHARHFCTQYCDKRSCNKNIFLGYGYLWAKVSSLQKNNQGIQKINKSRHVFPELTLVGHCNLCLKYRNIFYLFISIVCAKILCVTWALWGNKSDKIFINYYGIFFCNSIFFYISEKNSF